MGKEEMILKDFLERIAEKEIADKYIRLYSDQTDDFKRIFAYFHGSFNSLFEFLNRKNAVNKHYNADGSRELLALIEEFEELQYSLKETGREIVLKDTYQKALETCKTFLKYSGGSPIPEDFEPITLVKYEPALELPNKIVHIPQLSHMQPLTMVGQGAFSIVQKYKDSFYNKFFAIKQAKKSLDKRELARFKREFEIMQELNFPYVLEVYGYDEQKNSYIMEYCDSTLHDYVTENSQKLSHVNRKKLALQFLYGINYLHAKGLLHRDISYRNILIRVFDNGAALIKLSDFGLVKEKESIFTKSETEIKGTIIDPFLERFKDYNQQNEIYSVGVILLFILTGKKNLKSGASGIFKIVEKCTDKDISNRYANVGEIIKEVDLL